MRTNKELIEALERHTHLTYTEYDEEDNSIDYIRSLSAILASLEEVKANYEGKHDQIVAMIKDGRIEGQPIIVEGKASFEQSRLGNVIFLGHGQLAIVGCMFGELLEDEEMEKKMWGLDNLNK